MCNTYTLLCAYRGLDIRELRETGFVRAAGSSKVRRIERGSKKKKKKRRERKRKEMKLNVCSCCCCCGRLYNESEIQATDSSQVVRTYKTEPERFSRKKWWVSGSQKHKRELYRAITASCACMDIVRYGYGC